VSLFTDVSLFTELSVFTQFSEFSVASDFPPGGPSVIVPDPRNLLDFDPVAGRDRAVDTVPGIGPVRAARLRAIGVETVTDFVERGSAELAEGLGLSEVRVAELQDIARRSTVDREG
jgi:hypothetical protein